MLLQGLTGHSNMVGLLVTLRAEVSLTSLTPDPVSAHVECGLRTQYFATIIFLIVIDFTFLYLHERPTRAFPHIWVLLDQRSYLLCLQILFLQIVEQ